MRTTLDIDDAVLMAAKELARREHKRTGEIVSRLLGQAMTQPAGTRADPQTRELML